MIVCLCEGVSDREIKSAAKSGARSLKQVTRSCGAGGGCGACHRQIEEIVDQCSAERRPSLTLRAALPVLVLGG